MSNYIIVTHKEMVDFINAQPDYRIVDFDEPDFNSACGCVMLQYFRDKGFIPMSNAPGGVGISSFHDEENHILERDYITYRPNLEAESVFTYKEMKAHVNG